MSQSRNMDFFLEAADGNYPDGFLANKGAPQELIDDLAKYKAIEAGLISQGKSELDAMLFMGLSKTVPENIRNVNFLAISYVDMVSTFELRPTAPITDDIALKFKQKFTMNGLERYREGGYGYTIFEKAYQCKDPKAKLLLEFMIAWQKDWDPRKPESDGKSKLEKAIESGNIAQATKLASKAAVIVAAEQGKGFSSEVINKIGSSIYKECAATLQGPHAAPADVEEATADEAAPEAPKSKVSKKAEPFGGSDFAKRLKEGYTKSAAKDAATADVSALMEDLTIAPAAAAEDPFTNPAGLPSYSADKGDFEDTSN